MNNTYQPYPQPNSTRTTHRLLSTTIATTVSIQNTQTAHTSENPQRYPLSAAPIAFICITVLLLIVIILLLKWRSDRKRLSAYINSQESSRPLTDYERGYVESNNVIPSKRGEIRKPEPENKAHDYIYLEDNDADMKIRSHESIPEVIYKDAEEPDKAPNTSEKADPIYHMIDTEAESDPKPGERTGDPDPSLTNLYHIVDLDNVAEKS